MTVQGEDEYAATVSKLRDILDKRRHMYAQADVHVPLEVSPTDPGDCGATPAVVSYRCAGTRTCLIITLYCMLLWCMSRKCNVRTLASVQRHGVS